MQKNKIENLFQSISGKKDQISYFQLWNELEKKGIRQNDPRLAELRKRIVTLEQEGKSVLRLENFHALMEALPGFDLIRRTISDELVVSKFPAFKEGLIAIYNEVKDLKGGHVADYIPELRDIANKDGFAVSICTKDGQMFSFGDVQDKFGLQSTCKSINYLIALDKLSEKEVHQHIGQEPSGLAFNAPQFKRLRMDASEKKKFSKKIKGDYKLVPHNPLINAGAIMCCSLIASLAEEGKRSSSIKMVRQYWEDLVEGSEISTVLPDPAVEESENDSAHTNIALSHFMLKNGIWPERKNGTSPKVEDVLTFYFKCCAMELNAEMMAIAAATLANAGQHPFSHKKIFKAQHVKNCLSMMYSCGMYDYSGEFAFKIGLPAKSGVSGALMVVVPGKMGICIWSPKLDENGNSVRGIEFCRRLGLTYNLHVYDGLVNNKQRDIFNLNAKRLTQKTLLINAASDGDLDLINSLINEGMDLSADNGDYDKRTPMHLAAVGGHLEVIKLLVAQGAQINPVDRWGSTPLDEAYDKNHLAIIQFLEEKGGQRNNQYRDSVSIIIAASKGNLSILKAHYEAGKSLDLCDYDKRSPLHLATVEGKYETVKYLLEEVRENPNPVDRWGKPPLEEGTANEVSPKIIKLLKKHNQPNQPTIANGVRST